MLRGPFAIDSAEWLSGRFVIQTSCLFNVLRVGSVLNNVAVSGVFTREMMYRDMLFALILRLERLTCTPIKGIILT
jgi:hypothetical protein